MSATTPESIEASARLMAIAGGCNCDVEITIDEVLPQVFKATVAHDEGCGLLLRRARGAN